MTLTYTSIENFVKIMLGSPVVDVELTTDQLQRAVDHAVNIYGHAKPLFKTGTINVLPSTQKYALTANQYGRGILEVCQPDIMRQPISLDQFDVFKYHTMLPNLDPADFYLERVWWNEVRRSAGSDEDWHVDDHNDGTADLYISPIPSQAYVLQYVYMTDPTLATIPLNDEHFVEEYTLALVKQIVGAARRKFGGVPGAESAVEMDGAALVQEGLEKQKELDEELRDLGSRCPPVRGG